MNTIFSATGLPPGTPVFIGEQKSETVKITIIDYDEEHAELEKIFAIEDAFPYKDSPAVTWINIDGLHDPGLLERLGRHYGLHPLTIEDILNTQQRPKVETFDTYILIVIKMHRYDEHSQGILIEQVSVILGERFVLTFQEAEGDVFEPIRERIQHNKGRIRKTGADYLAYSLLDAIVDSYFAVLERIEEEIEDVEELLIENPDKTVLEDIFALRRVMLFFWKSAWPLRNITSDLQQQTPLVQEAVGIYLRDLHDHIMQVLETIETFREMLTVNLDIYLSSTSNKMNEVMKFLTIIGTIFIPLTFIAGIYGMNFQFMPELTWRWGYFAVLAIMAATGGALLLYFKKKKWI